MRKWPLESYARILVDNHITEDDPSFMTKFDPAQYVAMMKKAGVDSSMVYASCHNGNCYYPTKVGHMHKNLHGRDIFGQTVTLLRKEGISPLAYYTVTYHNHSAKTHPAWRQQDALGKSYGGRYWFCCPNNSDYRDFIKAQLSEIAAYDIDGIWIDMTFFHGVCYCPVCREKYMHQTNREMPRVIDWHDEGWVKFQRMREQWLNEFAHELTGHIKNIKPEMTVSHQFSPVLMGWYLAQGPGFADASNYPAGDFYGDKHQQRFGTKVMTGFSKNMPHEWSTSRCVNLRDHTSMKSEAEMVCSAATTLANGGAYFFIDAINTDGTLYPPVYDRLEKVGQALRPFKDKMQELKPRLLADTAMYFSLASNVDEHLNGVSLEKIVSEGEISNMDPTCDNRVIQEQLGTSIVLNRAHIPYRIITEKTTDFSGLKTIIANNAAFMSEAETQRIRKFVADGGILIATGKTSYFDLEGRTSGDFAMGDVFGVSYTGKKSKRVNYLVPTDGELVSCKAPGPLVRATSAEVLGRVAEPLFDPDAAQYASIHSDPPGYVSEFAGLTVNKFGKGRCVYLYSQLLALRQDAQQLFGVSLFKRYAPSDLIISTTAPSCVEITLLKGTAKTSLLVCFVNYQQELPNIPVCDVKTTLRLPAGITARTIRRVSDNKVIDCRIDKDTVTIELSHLETVEMIEIQ